MEAQKEASRVAAEKFLGDWLHKTLVTDITEEDRRKQVQLHPHGTVAQSLKTFRSETNNNHPAAKKPKGVIIEHSKTPVRTAASGHTNWIHCALQYRLHHGHTNWMLDSISTAWRMFKRKKDQFTTPIRKPSGIKLLPSETPMKFA